tara:strand:- start:3610 stop:4107 length:498 start_codon:yes stop_codon:yes gene_type:complete
MIVSHRAIEKLKIDEGFSSKPYPDASGYSIGYGHFIQKGEKYTFITKQDAELLLIKDLQIAINKIKNAIIIPLNQNQIDALVLFAYNTGRSESTLYNLINKNAPESEIKKWWISNYITSLGKYFPKLKDRRIWESNLFFEKMNPAAIGSGIALILIPAILYFIYK